MYDYLIVGCGLYGAVFGRKMADAGHKVLLIDKRHHFGGNVFTESLEDIQVHKYGPHIFHTNSKRVWEFVNEFTNFNNYRHAPKATFQGKIYSLPFNMNTFNQLWGVTTPEEAKRKIESQRVKIAHPSNLEEWALSEVGPDIYQTLIYGYTKKQWQRDPKELPASIIARLPVRFTFDDNYFNDHYQGIPTNGYSQIIENIIEPLDVRLGEDFKDISDWRKLAKKLVYSGPIDEFFDYKYGQLEYRSLRFEDKIVDGNFQGVAQMNYTDINVPWTRIVEHKHFMLRPDLPKSIITYEYSEEWTGKNTPYYPINDNKNNALYAKYRREAKREVDVIFGGRLASFKYMDMDTTIGQALSMSGRELNHNTKTRLEP